MKTMVLQFENDDGDEVEVEVPAKFEVCPKCEGSGSHVNKAVDGHGISREEFDQDPDFEEAYFSGRYDVTCTECDGLRVAEVIDHDLCTPEQKTQLAEWERQQCLRAQWRAEERHERAMGY